jgi:hypothetical protein
VFTIVKPAPHKYLPKGSELIFCLDMKINEVVRKARLVAQEFPQRPDIDYDAAYLLRYEWNYVSIKNVIGSTDPCG